MTRSEKLNRYRHLRAISARQHDAAVKFVGRGTLLDYGRRIGIVHDSTFVCDSIDEMTLAFDLAIHTSRQGRSRAIDRYARTVRATPGSDEAIMLKAAQDARFALWRVEGLHATAGLTLLDIANDITLWLMDEGLEASAPIGSVYAGRLMAVDDFVMTCGATVPVDEDLIIAVWDDAPRWRGRSRAAAVQDPRFAIAMFRASISTGMADKMQFLDPQEASLEAVDAA
jgi:hypothetical protein